jgi:hypothetical protein
MLAALVTNLVAVLVAILVTVAVLVIVFGSGEIDAVGVPRFEPTGALAKPGHKARQFFPSWLDVQMANESLSLWTTPKYPYPLLSMTILSRGDMLLSRLCGARLLHDGLRHVRARTLPVELRYLGPRGP